MSSPLLPAAAVATAMANGRGGDVPGSSEDDHGTAKETEAQHGDEGPVTEKPRVEDEEAELLITLKRFRKHWMESFSEFYGPFEATTGPEVGPKFYTERSPFGAMHYDALEIFSLKVTEIKEGLEWPLRVFGLVAVRDSMDFKRNILFQRSKENCQILTAEDPYLVLTGPSRAIALIDPPKFEVELRVIGSSPSEEKILSATVFTYNNNNTYNECLAGVIRTRKQPTKRSTIELKYSHLKLPLEATIEIHHSEGSRDFHVLFFARAEYMGEEKIVLLNSTDRKVTVALGVMAAFHFQDVLFLLKTTQN